jgi:hypothetical protein
MKGISFYVLSVVSARSTPTQRYFKGPRAEYSSLSFTE